MSCVCVDNAVYAVKLVEHLMALTSRCMQASTKTKIRGPPMSNSSRFNLRVLLLAIQVDRCKMPVMSMPSSAEWKR